MSASLVGSEMCIRDRGIDSPSDVGQSLGHSAPLLLSPGLRVVSGTEAVSYTHLTLPTICSV
eukprot:1784046-Alexandrium_andersonii.AAC.1